MNTAEFNVMSLLLHITRNQFLKQLKGRFSFQGVHLVSHRNLRKCMKMAPEIEGVACTSTPKVRGSFEQEQNLKFQDCVEVCLTCWEGRGYLLDYLSVHA